MLSTERNRGVVTAHSWRWASFIVVSLSLTIFSLTFAQADQSIVLCAGIAVLSGLSLLVWAIANEGRERLEILFALAIYLSVQTLLATHYMLVRDHVRWALLFGPYQARVLAQPAPANQGLKHVEWDGWGFAGADTTVFLVFDPADALAAETGAQPPVNARGLPCEVVRVRRLESEWYAVLFYTETYWGQDMCR